MKCWGQIYEFRRSKFEIFLKFATESELFSQILNETVQGVNTACLGCQGVGNREPIWVWLLGCGIRSEKVLKFLLVFVGEILINFEIDKKLSNRVQTW